jgi:hypothetical protein
MEYRVPMDRETIDAIAREVHRALRQDLIDAGIAPAAETPLADRWQGGELILKPGRAGVQEKAIPLESFFHKIVLVRERLRVLEQKINSHPKLDDSDRLELQDYITRIYGSFTTFNVLFDDRTDWFVGQSAER